MGDNVHANLAAIQNMEAACERFAHVVKDSLPSIERELERASQALDERRFELQREISNLQDEISSADEEDDTSWASSRIEEAEEELASVRHRTQRLAAAGAAVTGQTRKIEDLASDHAIRTREFLRGTANDLKAYFAKTLEGISDTAFVSAGGISSAAPQAKSGAEISGSTNQDVGDFKNQQGPLAVEAKLKEYEQRLHEYPELANLTAEEYLAINRYSQHDYALINGAFRADDKGVIERWGAHIRLANQGLQKLPAYKGVVYRAVQEGQFLENYVPGRTIIEKSFTSTSQDLRSTMSFGKTHFEILSKTGRDVKSCSAMQSAAAREKEVLFAPYTKFEVTGRFERDGATIIQMREL